MSNDPGYRIVKVPELWPDHAGHDVRYSEYGRTDYRVLSIEVDLSDLSGCVSVASAEYEPAPIDGDVTETQYWCAECGVDLPAYWDEPDDPIYLAMKEGT